jgi:N6-adenosine-specific RNA methylase IME4
VLKPPMTRGEMTDSARTSTGVAPRRTSRPDLFTELSPPYTTIVADPPWHYDERVHEYGHTHRRGSPPDRVEPLRYSTMSVDEIAALPVFDLSTQDAHLYLWTTQRYIWDARHVCLAWGFAPAQVLTWCKPPAGHPPGGVFASTTEFVIYARRYHAVDGRIIERAGTLIREARQTAGLTRADLHRLVRGGTPTGIVFRWENNDSLPNEGDWRRLQATLPALRGVERPYVQPPERKEQARVDRSWWEWPRTSHSAKPPAFLDLVERVSPGPYVELFARAPRLGWDSWGHGYELEDVS